MRHAIVVCVSIVLSLPAAEHFEQLCPESFAHEKVQEEIGDVVEIEQEMSEIRGELVDHRVGYFSLSIVHAKQILRVVHIRLDPVGLGEMTVEKCLDCVGQVQHHKSQRDYEEHQ